MEGGGKESVSGALDAVVAHYERVLAEHGPNARGMNWKDEASQRLRFEVLCGVADLQGLRVCEIGCGAGHLLDFLEGRGMGAIYRGVDLSPAMIAAARKRHPTSSFERVDFLAETLPPADVVMCSGVFHVKLDSPRDAWQEYVERSIRRLYDASGVALAFNLMSDQVDYRDENLHYANPGEVFEFCRRELSRRVVLRHDYPLYEFTIYVYRDDPD